MTDAPLYPEPPAALAKLTARSLMRYFGPGAILASVTIGSGELVWDDGEVWRRARVCFGCRYRPHTCRAAVRSIYYS